MLQQLNITPGTRGELMLRNRLLGSTEPWSTFALANSLSGYIAGPIVILLAVGLFNLVRKDAPGSRWSALTMAAPLVLVLLVCLTLGKSRSAYLGVATGLCLLALRARAPCRAAYSSQSGSPVHSSSPPWCSPVSPPSGSIRKS